MDVRKIKYSSDELYHFGILGQKWGERRYQNTDGSLTPAGRAHYGYGAPRAASIGGATVIKKSGSPTGNDYHMNTMAMDTGFDRGTRASSISNPRIKHKGANSEENRVYNVNDPDSDYANLVKSEHLKQRWLEKMGQKDRNNTISEMINDLRDKRVDELRESEVTLIGSGYLDMVRNNSLSSSKAYARAQAIGGNELGSGISPYADNYDPSRLKRQRNTLTDFKDIDELTSKYPTLGMQIYQERRKNRRERGEY